MTKFFEILIALWIAFIVIVCIPAFLYVVYSPERLKKELRAHSPGISYKEMDSAIQEFQKKNLFMACQKLSTFLALSGVALIVLIVIAGIVTSDGGGCSYSAGYGEAC